MDDVPYEVSGSDKVRHLEEDLARELTELKNEIEENEMLHGITKTVRCAAITLKSQTHIF